MSRSNAMEHLRAQGVRMAAGDPHRPPWWDEAYVPEPPARPAGGWLVGVAVVAVIQAGSLLAYWLTEVWNRALEEADERNRRSGDG